MQSIEQHIDDLRHWATLTTSDQLCYEQDPFDATLLALFWPVIWGAYIVMSIVELVSKPLCFVYNRSYEIARRKKRGQ